MTATAERTSETRGEAPRPLPSAWAVAVVVALAVGLVVRLHSASALWLDEALSVNIARLPVAELPEALRRDGSPPFYYLLLHWWMSLFGTGTTAVRALSTLFSLAALPIAWYAARRLGDATTGWIGLLLVASCPFVVRYAAETRMYSLVLLLVLAGVLVLHRALERPDGRRLVPVSVVSGILLLTHYWSLYLLAVTGTLLLAMSVTGRRRREARRCVVALAAGGLLFLPWLPSFLFQARHTGTPWARRPKSDAVLDTISVWAGGRTLAAGVLTLLLLGLVVLALLGHRAPGGVALRLPVHRTAGALALVSFGTLALGVLVAQVGGGGYAARYSSVAVGPFLLTTALGLRQLPGRVRRPMIGVTVLLGLLGSVQIPLSHDRTQAAPLARAIRANMQPGDVVVYCPDQNGPAVSRLLPAGTQQVVYPTFDRPERIDWRDYAERNAQASPAAFAERVLALRPRTIWLVARGGHLTFGRQCEELDRRLASARGLRILVVPERHRYAERATLTRY